MDAMSDAEVLAFWRSDPLGGKRPEAHPLIAPPLKSPPESVEPFLLGPASVEPGWSDLSYLHCNICRTSAKFKQGGWYAYYGGEHIFLIGPVCGNEMQQRNLKAAIKTYDDRVRREIADERTLGFLD